MTGKEKAPGSAATLTGARTETAADKAHSSCTDFTTTHARCQDRLKISDVLPGERENALKMSELKQLFNGDSRTIRLMIQRERRCVPILADNKSGYWVSRAPDEVHQFTQSMRRRARQIMRTAANVERAAGMKYNPQIYGQVEIWGGDNGA